MPRAAEGGTAVTSDAFMKLEAAIAASAAEPLSPPEGRGETPTSSRAGGTCIASANAVRL